MVFALVKQETEIRANQALELVENAAHGVDDMLREAAGEALTGHQYLNVMIKAELRLEAHSAVTGRVRQ